MRRVPQEACRDRFIFHRSCRISQRNQNPHFRIFTLNYAAKIANIVDAYVTPPPFTETIIRPVP